MNKDKYLFAIEQRLQSHFDDAKKGIETSQADKHRLEGFMQGAIFMGYTNSAKLAGLMETIHFNVFAKTIAQRQSEKETSKKGSSDIDYDHIDTPTYERKNKQSN